MSWDIIIQNIPLEFRRLEDIPDDYVMQPIGQRTNLIHAIAQIVPDANFSDLRWGRIDRETFSIEINIGDEDIVEDFAFHVRGYGDEAVQTINLLLERLNVRAIDTTLGQIYDPIYAYRSFKQWGIFAEQVHHTVTELPQSDDESRK